MQRRYVLLCCNVKCDVASLSGRPKDLYMLQLASTEEYIDGQMTGNLGEVLIRYARALLSMLSARPC